MAAVTVCSNMVVMACSKLMLIHMLMAWPLMVERLTELLMVECNTVNKFSINNNLSMPSRFNTSNNSTGLTLSCLSKLMAPSLRLMATVMLSNNIDEQSFSFEVLAEIIAPFL